MDNIVANFFAAAATHSTRPALVVQGHSTSYAALLAQVQGIRAALRQRGYSQAGARIGVWTADHTLTYASMLAVLAEGMAYVPVNHKFPTQRNVAVLQEAALTALLAVEENAALTAVVQAAPLPVLHTNTCTPILSDDGATPLIMGAETMAYLLFTSGSTGRPKGVPIHHGALHSFMADVLHPAQYTLGARDRFLQMFELTFDLSVYSWLAPLSIGACCCTVPEEGISYLSILEVLESQQITVALMVPSVLAYLRRYFDEIRLPALRYSLFCGEALPAELAQAWQGCVPQAQVENVYGPTEATIFCTRYVCGPNLLQDAHRGVVSIGQAMRGVLLCLLDEQGKPNAQQGELCLGGPQVTLGYWQSAERNAEAFVQVDGVRYYRTGDLCQLSAAGQYQYLGRADHQVKVDGYRVELGEIEHHARLLSGAQQVAVVAVAGAGGNAVLHLFLEHFTGDAEVLRQALQQVLPAYMQPRQIHTLAAFPLNSNGKIDRKALAAGL